MNFIDMRTIILSYTVSNAICAAVVTFLWLQNRRRFAGLGFWLADFVMQFVAIMLIALRGAVPDLVSMVVSNTLLILGTILLYAGLERFVEKRSPQVHNAILLVVFILVHMYFVVIQPNLVARNINISVGLLLLCSQAAWLMLYRANAGVRPITRGVGVVFVAFCVISVIRIIVDLAAPPENDFFHSNVYDVLLVLTYQMLFIILTFSLALMVNRRLFADLEGDIITRKQVEAALRLSEEKFFKAFQSSPDAIIISRLSDGRLIEVNDGFCHLTGYTREEALASSSIAMGLWANPQDRNRLIADLRKNQPVHDHEYDFRTKSGRLLNCIYSGEIINLGGEAHILSVVRDITESRRSEEIIRLRLRLWEYAATSPIDELMQKALDEIEVLTGSLISFYHFVEKDQNTLSLQAWSTRTLQEFCKAQGKGLHYSIDEAGVWVDCVHQRKPVIHNSYAALPHRKGMPDGHAEVVRELVVPTLRGDRVVSILGVGNKPSDYDEKDVELIAYVADITWSIVERKRGEVQLQEYQSSLEAQNMELRKFSLAIEQSGSTIVITDKEGTIQYANPRFEETTGYTVREALGQNPRILKSGEQDAAFYQVLWATISGGQIWYGEFHNRRKDGTQYWERATIAPVHNNAGQIVNYIGIKDDITERKQAEESLRQSNTELQARNEELDTFGHTVAHDLKNPLSNIIGFAFLMEDRENPLSAEEIYQMARTIKKMGLKMDSIIEELMLLAGLHKAEVKMEPLNMANIVAEIVERLGPQIQDSQARLTCPTDWPQAMGYAPWVGEVWVNYFSNAIKYGGHPPHIELGATQEGDVVRCWIHDNGPGLSPEEQARLFTPFERLEQAGLSGHGLGLSIVRRIVERMGGQVSVKSTGIAGEGSTFSFTLPAA